MYHITFILTIYDLISITTSLRPTTQLGIRLREGHSREAWLKRATDTANFLEKMLNSYTKEGGPDIVALQEVRM